MKQLLRPCTHVPSLGKFPLPGIQGIQLLVVDHNFQWCDLTRLCVSSEELVQVPMYHHSSSSPLSNFLVKVSSLRPSRKNAEHQPCGYKKALTLFAMPTIPTPLCLMDFGISRHSASRSSWGWRELSPIMCAGLGLEE